MFLTDVIVRSYAILTIVGQVLAILLIASYLFQKKSTRADAVISWVSSHGLLLMLITATLATAGSLYFSEIALWTPCKLCWLQRIFMYPQVLLLGFALWKKDRGIAPYILILAVIGGIIAAYHYSEQIQAVFEFKAGNVDALEPCDDTGVSCAASPFFSFDYITIPLMAFTVFLLNAIGAFFMMKRR